MRTPDRLRANRYTKIRTKRHQKRKGKLYSEGFGSRSTANTKHKLYEVYAPKYVELMDKGGVAVMVQQVFQQVFVNERKVILRLDRVESITAAGALYLAAAMDICHRAELGSRQVEGVFPGNRSVTGMLDEIGFWQFIGVENVPVKFVGGPSRFVKVQSGRRVTGESVVKLEKNMQQSLNLEQMLSEQAYNALTEVMTNVPQHAYMEIHGRTPPKYIRQRWWLVGYYDDQLQQLSIVFCDLGWGIPRTLEHTPFGASMLSVLKGIATSKGSDGQRILYAIKARASRTGQLNRGKGLGSIDQVINEHGSGTAIVLSGNAGVVYEYGKGWDTRSLNRPILGTMIEWRLPMKLKQEAPL